VVPETNLCQPGTWPARQASHVIASSARAGARDASCADFGVGVWDFKPKTGVVLSLLLFPAIAGPPHIVDCARYLQTPEEPKRDPKRLWRKLAVNIVPVRRQPGGLLLRVTGACRFRRFLQRV
jgi:hypothetical protein